MPQKAPDGKIDTFVVGTETNVDIDRTSWMPKGAVIKWQNGVDTEMFGKDNGGDKRVGPYTSTFNEDEKVVQDPGIWAMARVTSSDLLKCPDNEASPSR